MQIVFMGTPDYATEILKEILKKNITVNLVLTQPDKPVGRKAILSAPSVKQFLTQNYPNIEILQPKSLKNDEIVQKIKDARPDFIVVAAYGKILPIEVLNITTCINLHASILPNYRGASPIQQALLNGDEITGVTSMLMSEGMDEGDILEIQSLEIKDRKFDELYKDLSLIAAKLTVETLNDFDTIKPIKQNDKEATYCSKITKDDGIISCDDDYRQVYNKFRAFSSWPTIYFENGIKLTDIQIYSHKQNAPIGEITNISKNSFTLQFKNGEIEIFSLQEPSKKVNSAQNFINGKRLKLGNKIS